MNKKGYTLVELLAIVVIIALLSGVGVISYYAIINQSKDKTIEAYLDTMHTVAVNYYIDHSLPSSSEVLLLSDLVNGGLIEKINNPYDNNDYCLNSNSYINALRQDKEVKDKNNNVVNVMISLTYTVNLNCDNKTYNKVYIN